MEEDFHIERRSVNGKFKTNTVLQYNENYEGVVEWGARALVPEISRRESRVENLPRPIELFKLHLGNVPKDQKSKLPFGLTPKELSSQDGSSDPAQALYAEGEQLTEWLLVKYNAIAVLDNSNKHDKYIQYLKTILSKSQSIQTKQIQQLSEDEVQGLRNAKNSMENYITENIQKNIKLLEDELVNLNEYSQNGIKTKDDLIYQQEKAAIKT
ncbi:14803_t:CDS:2 [Dentiscutata erythropus]|uniref:14803_t:CDS:1 n=1 Tax=Dentiscutata erythropus TaxID=1348616 RepID=A0A9N8VAJ1_9GLOM|nr:14803_t:CDS:2 [Dentiscutata erythropus]